MQIQININWDCKFGKLDFTKSSLRSIFYQNKSQIQIN